MKNHERINTIIKAMPSFSKELYSKDELLPELLEIQKELVALTFNDEHAENARLRIWDVENHLEKLNNDRGHVADEELKKFMEGCKIICNSIKSEMSGNAGEYKAFRSIEMIRCKKSVLKNIEFVLGDHRTELDGIILTEKAIFIVEVKNPSKDVLIDERGNYCRIGTTMVFDKNIGEKMNDKTYLLREALKTAGYDNPNIVTLVVFTNNNINVENRYEYIKTCFLGELPHIIERHKGDVLYTEDDFKKMEGAIEANKCHESYPLPLDINQFKTDFATVMVKLEEAEEVQSGNENLNEQDIEPDEKSIDETIQENVQHHEMLRKNPKTSKQIAAIVSVLAIAGVAAVAGVVKEIRK